MRSALTGTRLALAVSLALAACSVSGARTEPGGRPIAGPADGGARASWVIEQIADWNADLSDADLARKLDKMAGSPFVFFRGTNHLYWADLADDPRLADFGDDLTRTFIQGDLHAENFGTFHDDEGRIVYDLNDFDEALVADYQLDVWRMAVSIVLVARDNGLSHGDARDAVDAFAERYLDTLAAFRGNDREDDVRLTEEHAYGRLDELLDDVADERTREGMLDDWTVVEDGGRRLDTALEDLADVDDELRASIESAIGDYAAVVAHRFAAGMGYFSVRSVARRLGAGTGSLGTPRFYVLVEGPTDDPDDDVILDVKRQGPPTGSYYLPDADLGATFEVDAERVVVAQRAMLLDSDDHLGWLSLEDGSYSVRERSPWKDSLDTADLDSGRRLRKMAEQWGWLLAGAHARADRDFDPDLVPSSFEREVDERTDGEHSAFRALVREVAVGYADQVEADYAAFESSREP